ncbi:MAG: hypothetical protein ACLFVU_09855 [Phycisphaerae bacterium]
MAIKVTCPNCDASLQFPDEKRGQRDTCPKCRADLQVPETSTDTESPQPETVKSQDHKEVLADQGSEWTQPGPGQDIAGGRAGEATSPGGGYGGGGVGPGPSTPQPGTTAGPAGAPLRTSGRGIASIILGAFGILAILAWPVSILLGGLGVLFGVLGRRETASSNRAPVIGMILSLIALVGGLTMLILYLIQIAT